MYIIINKIKVEHCTRKTGSARRRQHKQGIKSLNLVSSHQFALSLPELCNLLRLQCHGFLKINFFLWVYSVKNSWTFSQEPVYKFQNNTILAAIIPRESFFLFQAVIKHKSFVLEKHNVKLLNFISYQYSVAGVLKVENNLKRRLF